jgi:hypothetical protein
MDGQIIASVVAVVGSLGGALIGTLIQREGKNLQRLSDELNDIVLEFRPDIMWLVTLGVWLRFGLAAVYLTVRRLLARLGLKRG